MTNLTCSPNNEFQTITVAPGTERYVKNQQGMTQREILSNDICCVCDKNIWVLAQLSSKAVILEEAFSVSDARAYLNGKPDYLSANAKPLLRCHYDCQQTLINELNNSTFIKR